jgi:hypothetical protein
VTRRRLIVRLFFEELLIATRWTERGRPESYYAIGPAVYDVGTFVVVHGSDGAEGFDVTLVQRR